MGNPDNPAQAHAFTRRDFLARVGAVGGAAAVHEAATALGLLPQVARAAPPSLAPAGTRPGGVRVLVLGAGIAGLTAAYELGRAGYDCTVLEASGRVGGRNLTIRGGDVIDELGARQRCEFDADPHLYFNAGPARIPASHTALLGYCRELGVPLEVFVNENRNAWVHDDAAFGGRPMRYRELAADARGFLAELLAKGLDGSAIDTVFTPQDAERVRELARAFGDLAPDFRYRGSARAGLASGGMVTPAVLKPAHAFDDILASNFWRGPMLFGESEDQSAPMLTPVGGMDHIPRAFARVLGERIQLGARVTAVTLQDDGVSVAYVQAGVAKVARADFCLSCVPSHLLAGIDNNFPAEYRAALTAIPRGNLFKLAFQARERFWERESIYGGISWTTQEINQLWYPSHGLQASKGVLLGAYIFGGDVAARFTAMSPAERNEAAIAQGERIHPGYRQHVEKGVSVAWHRMNHMLGCAARWTEELRQQYFARLQQPVGRHWLIGDQVSYHPGWQEGAIRSALYAIAGVDAQVRGGAATLAGGGA